MPDEAFIALAFLALLGVISLPILLGVILARLCRMQSLLQHFLRQVSGLSRPGETQEKPPPAPEAPGRAAAARRATAPREPAVTQPPGRPARPPPAWAPVAPPVATPVAPPAAPPLPISRPPVQPPPTPPLQQGPPIPMRRDWGPRARPPAPAAPGPHAPTPRGSLEVAIGQRWLAYVGIAVLLAAIAFFLHLAYTRGWLPRPSRRVASITAAGFLMIGLGHWFSRKQYRALAMVLLGGGPAAIFAAGMFAWLVFELIPPRLSFLAFAWLAGVSVLAVLMSLYYDSMVLATAALVGGFAAPVVIGARVQADPNYFFSYILILDIGVLVLSYFKQWRLLNHLLFAGTVLVFVIWAADVSLSPQSVPVALATAWASAYLVLFWLTTTVLRLARPWEPRADDKLLPLRNSIVYALGVSWLLCLGAERAYTEELGYIFFGLAGLYLLQCLLLIHGPRPSPGGSATAGAIAAAAAAIAAPLVFDGDRIQTVWALEALVALAFGIRYDLRLVRAANPILLVMAVLKLLASYATTSGDAVTPMWNTRSGSALVIALAFALSGIWLRHFGRRSDGKAGHEGTAVLCNVICHLLVIGAFTAETLIWFRNPAMRPAHAPLKMAQFLLSGGYAIYAIALVIAGFAFKRQAARILGLLLFGVAAVKVCIFDVSHLTDWMRIGAFGVLGLMMLVGSWLYYCNRDYLNRELLGIGERAAD